MRNFVCRASFVLCLACVGMAVISFIMKIDDPRPKAATWAMFIWVYVAWVFAIINYVTLPGKKPPPVNFGSYFESMVEYALKFISSIPSDQFGCLFWFWVLLIVITYICLAAPAVRN